MMFFYKPDIKPHGLPIYNMLLIQKKYNFKPVQQKQNDVQFIIIKN